MGKCTEHIGSGNLYGVLCKVEKKGICISSYLLKFRHLPPPQILHNFTFGKVGYSSPPQRGGPRHSVSDRSISTPTDSRQKTRCVLCYESVSLFCNQFLQIPIYEKKKIVQRGCPVLPPATCGHTFRSCPAIRLFGAADSIPFRQRKRYVLRSVERQRGKARFPV